MASSMSAPPHSGAQLSHGQDIDDARSSSPELNKRARGPQDAERPVPFRPCLPPGPKRMPAPPPESVGRILILSTGRLGVLSKRDETGKRKQIGVVATETAAQAAIRKALEAK